jgi:hypothetical protein
VSNSPTASMLKKARDDEVVQDPAGEPRFAAAR